jgi:TonB-dependent SusC/RagA subfamily outer membrane receptor
VTRTEPTEQREPGTRTISNSNSLADILIRLPGVMVDEAGLNTRVSVRGGSPLYVIDGMRVGRSYQSAAMAVSVNDIASVEVLKNMTETARYGRDAAYGVILINTRRS